jgi:fused signal recognition particle receptor
MGLFEAFRNGMSKTREYFSGNIHRIGARLGYFDDDLLDELEMVLVQADAGASCSMYLLDSVRNAIKESGDSSGDFVVSVLKKQITEILGEKQTLEIKPESLNILLLVGVNGTGKTTTAGKLCLRYKNEGLHVILAAADTFRAAAIEQLKHWGDLTSTPVIAHEQGADPGAVVYDAIHVAKKKKSDLLIIDTAGRLHNKQNLMDELGKIKRIIARETQDSGGSERETNLKTLLVIDATTGQNAIVQAKTFHEVTELAGIILTKLDSNAKGGIAISVAYETKIPILLAGLGEHAEDLVDFDPEYFTHSLF